MEHSKSKTLITDFTQGPVMKALLTFAFPLFLSNLLQAVYNVVDMVVVGQVVGEAGLSALANGGDLVAFLTFISMGFSTACQTIISQYIGANLRERLSRFIGTMASFLLLCAVVVSVVCFFLRREILTLLNTPAESFQYALEYSTTCMCGLVFIYGYNIVSAILRGMGDSKRPFVFISIAAVMNLVLDILFVVVFHWGPFGAAFATVLSQGFSFISALVYLYHRRETLGFTFSMRHFRIDRTELGPLLKLGIPAALSSASIMISKLFVNSFINSYGVTVSAVSGVTHKVDMFANLICFAISSAGSSMVGQNLGAGRYDRVKRIIGCSYLINIISSGIMTTLLLSFPTQIFGIFTQEAAVLTVCLEYIPVSMVCFWGSAVRGAMNTFNLGSGNYKLNYAVGLLDGIVARIGLSLLFGLVFDWGYFGFWMGNAVAGLTPFFLGIVYYLSGTWKKTTSVLKEIAKQEELPS